MVDSSDIECPFCDEKGFDEEGLEYHLGVYCQEYKKLTKESK